MWPSSHTLMLRLLLKNGYRIFWCPAMPWLTVPERTTDPETELQGPISPVTKGDSVVCPFPRKKKAITANLSEDQLQSECTVNREFFRRPCLSVHSTSAQVSPSLEKEGSQNELWVGCIVLMKYLLSYPSVSTVLKRKKKKKIQFWPKNGSVTKTS